MVRIIEDFRLGEWFDVEGYRDRSFEGVLGSFEVKARIFIYRGDFGFLGLCFNFFFFGDGLD